VQWDSFRFWETLCAGAVAFNLNLERYGVELPVMPRTWEHYIGVDFDHVEEVIDRLQSEPGLLAHVANGGREWALKYYSPAEMAKRFLQFVDTHIT
jgi:hypothetical protein